MAKIVTGADFERFLTEPTNDTVLDHITNIMQDPICRGQFDFLLKFYQVRALTRISGALQNLDTIARDVQGTRLVLEDKLTAIEMDVR